MKDKKLRIEDALSATKAAVEEGIVSGGGTALINVIPKVSKLVDTLENGEKLGAQIVLKALEEPVKQIARNAGLEPAVIADNVKKSEVGVGFDASKEEYVDMKKRRRTFKGEWTDCVGLRLLRLHYSICFQVFLGVDT